jgi:hypothetical protein
MIKSIRSIASSLTMIACGALLSLTPACAQEDPHLTCQAAGGCLTVPTGTLVGTWRVTVSPDGIPPFRAYNVFTADGNSLEFDNSNPPGQQSIAVGPWTKTGVNTYAFLEINQLYDAQGTYQGEFRVTSTITLETGGNLFTGTFKFTVSDPSDMPVFQGGGTARGVRVSVVQ